MSNKTSSHPNIKVVIIDNRSLVRAGLGLIIGTQAGMSVVGDVGELEEAIELVGVKKPEIILFGMCASNGVGPESISMLLKKSVNSRIILISSSDESMENVEALKHGALGIVSVNDGPNTLIKAIKKVSMGEAWVDRFLVADILHNISTTEELEPEDADAQKIAELTSRERDIIKLIGKGYKNRQIAEELSLSETTVRHHLTSVYHKLSVTSRLELLVFANRHEMS